MSVGLAPPQIAAVWPLPRPQRRLCYGWKGRGRKEGGSWSGDRLAAAPVPASRLSVRCQAFSTLCGHLLPDGSSAFSLTLPCCLVPLCSSGPSASCEQLAQSCRCGLQLMRHSWGLLKSEMRCVASHCQQAAPFPWLGGRGRGSSCLPKSTAWQSSAWSLPLTSLSPFLPRA